MPALADRLFSWTVPIEGVEGKKGWDWDGGENNSKVGWWWEGTRRRAPISACCASKFTCFFSFYSPSLSLALLLPRCVLSVVLYRLFKEAVLHISYMQGFLRLIYIPHTKEMVQVQLQWSTDRKSIFVCLNDLVAPFCLFLHVPSLLLILIVYPQHLKQSKHLFNKYFKG